MAGTPAASRGRGCDSYSKYGYLYLIHKKSQFLDVLITFEFEFENQLNKRIKSIKSNYGGKYYGRPDGSSEQHHEPFARYLEEYEIIQYYTMS